MRPASQRKKVSTTVDKETYAYLEDLVSSGRAASLAAAVDWIVRQVRQAENRARLEADTAAYFQRLSPKAAREERRLGKAISDLVSYVDFDA